MIAPELAAEGLLLLAFLLAVRLAHPSRQPHHRPAALALGLLLLLDVVREGVRFLALAPARAAIGPDLPYAGLPRLAFHAEQGALLAFVAVELALYLHAFLKAPPWPVLAPWATLWSYAALSYPGLRRAPLLALYAHVHGAALLLGLLLAAAFVVRVARGEAWPSPLHWVALVLLASDAGLLAGPYLHPPRVLDAWPVANLINCLAYALVCLVEGRALWTFARRRGSRSSRSG